MLIRIIYFSLNKSIDITDNYYKWNPIWFTVQQVKYKIQSKKK